MAEGEAISKEPSEIQKSLLKRELKQVGEGFDITRLLFCEHHLSHAVAFRQMLEPRPVISVARNHQL